jgi:hypothetical protein
MSIYQAGLERNLSPSELAKKIEVLFRLKRKHCRDGINIY